MYRVVRRRLLAGFALSILALAPVPVARAGQTAAADAILMVAAAPSEPVGAIVDRRLAALRDAAKDGQERDWLAQLKSFYIARSGKPVWILDTGSSPAALEVWKELGNAADWGLDPAFVRRPELANGFATAEQRAEAEIALSRSIVYYTFQARGGRIDPESLSLWLNRTPAPVYATGVMIEMVSAADPAKALRAMNPVSPDFERLRQAYNRLRAELQSPRPREAQILIPRGRKINDGEYHPDVAAVRERLKIPAQAGQDAFFDDALGDAVQAYAAKQGLKIKWGVIDDRVRELLNRPPPPPDKKMLLRILANMERWRWLPHDLGDLYIWNNLPEQMMRVVQDGEILFEERIIVGEPDKQTPVFSETMKAIVFQPEWGVPPSIKINELLPKLQDGDYDVLSRRDMRILSPSGDEIDPEKIHWDRIDIRQVGIYQRSGEFNPLGEVKFLFPNKHHVYMHDTNAPSLFASQERTFSHGCIRVQNPRRLAEFVMGREKGWDAKKIRNLIEVDDTSNNKIYLDHPIPVHNVYFTLVPGPDNTLIELDDIYGHDKRVMDALSGVPASQIAANDPAQEQLRELEDTAPAQTVSKVQFGKAATSAHPGEE